MTYRLMATQETDHDLFKLAKYMRDELCNPKAALDFYDEYEKQIQGLRTFPFGYRGISFEYRGYEIRLKPFDSYNIFFIVDAQKGEIVILRVLKDRQDWKTILQNHSEYHL